MISSTNEETEKSDDIHISFLSFFSKFILLFKIIYIFRLVK